MRRAAVIVLSTLGAAALLGAAPDGALASAAGDRRDLLWLGRLTYGPDSADLASFRTLGRRRFLAQQLAAPAPLPAVIQGQIDALDVARAPPRELLREIAREQQSINAAPDDQKDAARKALNDEGAKFAYQAARTELLRAIYSPAQLQEQMVWFWLNHFSIFQYKGAERWLAYDYAEHAIRPNATGRFRDLVLATLTHPAMLQYLDNAQNAAGHINENYARELMELHTLGVDAGYTQEDVQALAKILTGVGINATDNVPRLKREWQPLYRHQGAFEFNPARHDFSDKQFLHHTVKGGGFAEVEQAIDLIIAQPACGRFIARKLALYFVSDNPPPSLVDHLARTFAHTHGDLRAVLTDLFESRELAASLGTKFKDPMRYVISAIRLAYDGRPIYNTHPVLNWLNALGEPLFGRQTPDGYPLTETGWASSGQMSRRFEIARGIGIGNAGLFNPEDGTPATATGFPQLSTRLYYAALEPGLSAPTREALDRAASQAEWNTFLLSSPDFNYE